MHPADRVYLGRGYAVQIERYHNPKPAMIAEAMIPRPGAASGVVPKNGIGIAF